MNWQISSPRKRDFFDLLAAITGSPGTPGLELEPAAEIGRATARIERARADAPIQRVELLIDNQVVATATENAYEFRVDVPDANHCVRVRAAYRSGDREVIVESPHYRNPWWPYGGRR